MKVAILLLSAVIGTWFWQRPVSSGRLAAWPTSMPAFASGMPDSVYATKGGGTFVCTVGGACPHARHAHVRARGPGGGSPRRGGCRRYAPDGNTAQVRSLTKLKSPPPAIRPGMNMRISFIAFATGRSGDQEFRRRL